MRLPTLRCPNGHHWDLPTELASGSGSFPKSCPVCGVLTHENPWAATLGLPPLPSVLPAPPTPSVPGYEVLEEVGQGGMGIVYRARQLDSDRQVALKLIRRERLASSDVIQRFQREAQAAARLAHPNIVALYEAGQVGDLHYLAMEFVPGLTLARLIEEQGKMEVWQACDCIRQAALALQHAAEQALVHRDIKPSNLMIVAPPGQPIPARPVLKVLDMGVARLYALRDLPEDSLTTLTRDGSVLGTPDYVAPEQLEDPHRADIRADLYSLGCTFYHLLSGQVPFPGGTLIQKLDRQRWHIPPSVDQLRPEVPGAVAAVVRRLMAKHPDDRYRSPAELCSVLEQLGRQGMPISSSHLVPLQETACLRGHVGPVLALAFTGADTLVSAGADRSLRRWDLAAEPAGKTFAHSPHEIGCLAVLPGTSHALAGQGASVRIWNPASGAEVGRLTGHIDAVRSLSVDPEGKLALTGSDDRSLRLWDLRNAREVQRLSGHKAAVASVALSHDGRHALSGGRDGSLWLWNVPSGRQARALAAPRGAVLAVAFAADGRSVVSGHFDTTLRLWERETGRELRRFSGHRQMVSCLACSPRHLISGSHDGTLRIWDPESGAEVGCCLGHSGPVLAVALQPNGRFFASAGTDATIRLWLLPDWPGAGN